jgi:uncharacterized protein (DUF1810 family)
MGLERFVEAQDGDATYESALAEIRAGRKYTHWIWFVFPQLAGLGLSPTSQFYAIADRDEAERYLRHPVLGARLLTITSAVAEQIRRGRRLDALMGSQIDAVKLVSSMTLFAAVARRLQEAGDPSQADIAAAAEDVLLLANAQGYAPCGRTRRQLGL